MEKDSQEINLVEIIGEGGYGVVWRGIWCNQDVAVKYIHDKKSFETELRRLSSVNHPNIVKLYCACTATQYLVMEYADCGSLAGVLHDTRFKYPLAQRLDWLLQCAKGVEHLHSKGIIHRDLKSDNLLLFNGYTHLKICDLGIACQNRPIMTNMMGTVRYMAPEVFNGSGNYNEKCDVYSFAILLWEIITGCIPFAEFEQEDLMRAVSQGRRPSLTMIPELLHLLLIWCWSPNPLLRLSMAEVVMNLTILVQLCRVPDNPVPLPFQQMRPCPAMVLPTIVV